MLLRGEGIDAVQTFPIRSLNKLLRLMKLPERFAYAGIQLNGCFLGAYSENKLADGLREIEAKYNLHYTGVYFEHHLNWNLTALRKALRQLDLPIELFVHDFDMMCGYLREAEGYGKKCRLHVEAPTETKCKGCVFAQNNLAMFRQICAMLAEERGRIRRVVMPSQSARNIWLRAFPEYAEIATIRPHLKLLGSYRKTERPHARLRIAYIGSTEEHKGYNEWRTLVADREIQERYDFYYFGRFDIDDPNIKCVRVDFRASNSLPMEAQLRIQEIDVVFLWSTCNETYCYTYFEALAGGAFVLTNPYSGNIADSVREYENGKILQSVEECITYLSNEAQVREDIQTYSEKRSPPLRLEPNADLEDLMFLNQDNGLEKPLYARRRSCCNKIVTLLYQHMGKHM